MKYTYITIFATILVLIGAQTAAAQDAIKLKAPAGTNLGSTTRGEIKTKMEAVRTEAKETRTEIKNDAMQKRTELKAEVKVRVTAMLDQRLEQLKVVLKNVLPNLQRLASKIEAQISNIRGQGKDVTASTAALANAKTKISVTESAVQAVSSITASSTDPRSTLDALKVANEAVRKANNEARQALEDALKALRADAGVRIEGNASTTTDR